MRDQGEFDYDVFISYSSHDKDWVRGPLLNKIENAGLRVFIDFRDFEPGAPTTGEIEHGLKRSRKALLVLTPYYIDSGWCEFELIELQTCDPANRNRRLIPLFRRHCQIPDRIKGFTYIDFTDGADFELAWNKLLTVLGAKPSSRQVEKIARQVEKIDLVTAILSALKPSGYLNRPKCLSRVPRFWASTFFSIGYLCLFILEGYTIYVGSRTNLAYSPIIVSVICAALIAGIGLFLSSLVADITLNIGSRRNLSPAFMILFLCVMVAAIMIGWPYLKLPKSMWSGENSMLHPGVPAYSFAGTIKNCFFYCLWGLLLYIPQMHYIAGLEDLYCKHGFNEVKPYINIPPRRGIPLDFVAPWFEFLIIALIVATLLGSFEFRYFFDYLSELSNKFPIEEVEKYRAALYLRDFWFMGLTACLLTWFYSSLHRFQKQIEVEE